MKGTIISLFDITGIASQPWAKAGYACYCYDIQHAYIPRVEYPGGGSINFIQLDLMGPAADKIIKAHSNVKMLFSWPVCTDLASSGAKHWEDKRKANPNFQAEAMALVYLGRKYGEYFGCPYVIENPVGAASTLWRTPDHIFDPCDYGGYLPVNDKHPTHPDYIAPRDAYTKRTCWWTGGGFVMPETKRVEPEILERLTKSGNIVRGSRQFMFLGGKSLKTKNIRSATPRGITQAVFEAQQERT